MGERIALLSSSYPRTVTDPAGHFVASEVAELASEGHELHVFAPGPRTASLAPSARVHWLEDRGCFGFPGALPRLREHPLRALGAAEFAARAVHALRKHGPFNRLVAHFFLPCACPICPLVARPGNASLEAVGHGSDVRLFCGLPQSVRRHIANEWLRLGVRLRVTSHELAAQLERAAPELAKATRVAASPIDTRSAPTRASARAALAISEATRVALIVARLVPEKGVETALRALGLVDGLRVLVVGDGPERARLSAAFPDVRFTGHLPRPEALRFIAAADVLVSGSTAEGAPTVVREARALGVPVVALEAGDLLAWAARDEGLWVVPR